MDTATRERRTMIGEECILIEIDASAGTQEVVERVVQAVMKLAGADEMILPCHVVQLAVNGAAQIIYLGEDLKFLAEYEPPSGAFKAPIHVLIVDSVGHAARVIVRLRSDAV